jgi:MOSC domain-containing protein YiiM
MPEVPTIIGLAVTPKIRAPMEERDQVEITVDAGIGGDARGTKRRRQISILFEEDWNDAVSETGDPMNWMERRANIFIKGMRSPQKEGGIFTIGDVTLEVMVETEPCQLMEEKRSGLRKALTPDWRGGVCCKVLSAGRIAVGDDVGYSES